MLMLSKEEAAKYLGTSENTIVNLTAKGCIDSEWNSEASEYNYLPETLDETEKKCQYHT